MVLDGEPVAKQKANPVSNRCVLLPRALKKKKHTNCPKIWIRTSCQEKRRNTPGATGKEATGLSGGGWFLNNILAFRETDMGTKKLHIVLKVYFASAECPPEPAATSD